MSYAHALPPPSPAPWAAVVPGMPPMTVDEVSLLPDDGWQIETDGWITYSAGVEMIKRHHSGWQAVGCGVALGPQRPRQAGRKRPWPGQFAR